MIHEIRPGDFVIVTVPTTSPTTKMTEHWSETMRTGAHLHFVQSTVATETSVHVLRKAGEAKVEAKADWPTWRDAKNPPPPEPPSLEPHDQGEPRST